MSVRRLALERRYPLPEVRLRFRSTEMAVLRDRPGDALLATAAFSNIGYSLVLLSGRGEVVRTVPGANVGWAMRPDGRGGLICGGRDLARFDPDSGRFETLADRPVEPEELWSACVTDRLVVMGSSTPRGTVAVYDRAARHLVKTFVPLGRGRGGDPVHAFYTYDIVGASDGKILVFSSCPRALISVLDPESLAVEGVVPAALEDSVSATGAQMLDAGTLFVRTESGALLLSYPGIELLARIPNPEGTGLGLRTCVHAGSVVAWGANRPMLLDRAGLRWTPMTDAPVGDACPESPETCVAMASLADGSLVGVTDSTCLFWRIEPGSRTASRRPVDLFGKTDGAPLAVGGGRAWGSSHAMQRLWSVDLETGEGADLGQCSLGGQANSMLWDDERGVLFMGTYPECRIRVYDPKVPPRFPGNPGVFAQIGAGLSRTSHQLLKLGGALWTSASMGAPRLGGALVRVDLASRQVEVFPDLVPEESPGEMALGPDGRTLYLGTTVHADCGANLPRSGAAHLLAFDSVERRLLSRHTPVAGAETVSVLCLDAGGRVLFLDGPRLSRGRAIWAWDVGRGSFERVGAAPDGLREVLPSPDGSELWATALAGVGPLLLGEECRIDLDRGHRPGATGWDQRMCKFLQWDRRDPAALWCVCFTEVLRFRLDAQARSSAMPAAAGTCAGVS